MKKLAETVKTRLGVDSRPWSGMPGWQAWHEEGFTAYIPGWVVEKYDWMANELSQHERQADTLSEAKTATFSAELTQIELLQRELAAAKAEILDLRQKAEGVVDRDIKPSNQLSPGESSMLIIRCDHGWDD